MSVNRGQYKIHSLCQQQEVVDTQERDKRKVGDWFGGARAGTRTEIGEPIRQWAPSNLALSEC